MISSVIALLLDATAQYPFLQNIPSSLQKLDPELFAKDR